MLDPITISAVVGGAKALKSAFDMSKNAMDEFRACAKAGMDAKQSFGALVNVFIAHGETQKQINEVKNAKIKPPVTEDGSPAKPAPKKSATVLALEAMQMERELRDQEEEIKNYLIYQCNESGLYDELCRRRDAIVNAEKAAQEEARRAETEKILEIKREQMAKKRKRRRIFEIVYNILGGFVITLIIAGFAWFIRWMFQQGGSQ
jgi:hypothetical protein